MLRPAGTWRRYVRVISPTVSVCLVSTAGMELEAAVVLGTGLAWPSAVALGVAPARPQAAEPASRKTAIRARPVLFGILIRVLYLESGGRSGDPEAKREQHRQHPHQ